MGEVHAGNGKSHWAAPQAREALGQSAVPAQPGLARPVLAGPDGPRPARASPAKRVPLRCALPPMTGPDGLSLAQPPSGCVSLTPVRRTRPWGWRIGAGTTPRGHERSRSNPPEQTPRTTRLLREPSLESAFAQTQPAGAVRPCCRPLGGCPHHPNRPGVSLRCVSSLTASALGFAAGMVPDARSGENP